MYGRLAGREKQKGFRFLGGESETCLVVSSTSKPTGLTRPGLQLFMCVDMEGPLSKGTNLRLLFSSSSKTLYDPFYRSANFLGRRFS